MTVAFKPGLPRLGSDSTRGWRPVRPAARDGWRQAILGKSLGVERHMKRCRVPNRFIPFTLKGITLRNRIVMSHWCFPTRPNGRV